MKTCRSCGSTYSHATWTALPLCTSADAPDGLLADQDDGGGPVFLEFRNCVGTRAGRECRSTLVVELPRADVT